MCWIVLFFARLVICGIQSQSNNLHDVAKIMFGFTIFWAYIGFSQYFLIWYGNMPEETQFYLLRRNGSWYEVSIWLPILYFVVPFFLLLPRARQTQCCVAGDCQCGFF